MKAFRLFLVQLFSILLFACGGSGGDSTGSVLVSPSGVTGGTSGSNGSDAEQSSPSPALPAGDTRDWLTAEQLNQTEYPHSSPIHNSHFMPVGDELPAEHLFSGNIRIDSRRLLGRFAEFHIPGDESFKNFPSVELDFVSHNGYLLPLNRGRQVLLGDNSFWGIILDPGKVWSESADNGWSRASFPFTLISARRNQAHNGLATFLYNDAEMSNLRIQVVQETTLWFQNDIYAQLAATYIPQQYSQSQQIKDDFDLELNNTVPIRPWTELDNVAANSDRRSFNSNIPDIAISQAALIKDGEVYLQGCFTRYGPYPFCRWMRNGAYSITKSLGAAFTLFRLAEKYGVQVFDLLIEDYVEVTATHAGWQGVTFGDVLNMASGVGDNGTIASSGDIFADENGPKMERWIAVNQELGKLDISFSYGNYSWGPGGIFPYNSALYMILAAALDNYYKSIVGPDADVWQMVVEEVYQPIGIQHVPMLRTIEDNNRFGIAEMFHGLYPNIDDLAKLYMLLQAEGSHSGQQLLHQQSLQAARFLTVNRGLRSYWEDNQFGESRYLYGFWSSPFGSCVKQVPYMSGYGGNVFAVMDNGMSVLRFTDANRYSPSDMIQIADRERAICD